MAREPIAIVGAACRFPGASSLADFWQLLLSEKFISRPLGETCVNHIPGVDEFDASFFEIASTEAISMDPQIRILMETTWEAIEDAGLTAKALAGSQTGVYVSALPSGYSDHLKMAGILDLHSIYGAGPWSGAAGRISYQFDLRGPSMGIEATCAGSLLSVHVACQAIWGNEIEMAIVGSANVLLDPQISLRLLEAGILSPSGQCRFAESTADGYVRSEGAGAVILKPYRRAVADGDHIRAVIIGTGAGHDGRSGKTQFAPGLASQEQMLRAAYSDAGVDPREVDYIEAHGPGTPAGDPVELTALRNVLTQDRDLDAPCLVGSAKSNIGHCEALAGLAGLMKTALGIEHGKIPATLHVTTPHPVIAQSRGGLVLPEHTMDWPRRGRPRIAGVSAFGLSGSNVHVVLAEPPRDYQPAASAHLPVWVLPISARHPESLRTLAGHYSQGMRLLTQAAGAHDMCFSAAVRRTHHDRRMAAVGTSPDSLANSLDSLVSGASRLPPAHTFTRPRVVFAFPGQGPSWRPTGAALLDTFPAFAKRMHECDEALEHEVGWTASSRLARSEIADLPEIQPVLWAVQVSLAALWEDMGIVPSAVVGHSMGEVAAATVAGALTIRDAAAIICRRSRLLDTLRGRGSMWVVHLDAESVGRAIADLSSQVSVGVINTDHSVVLAGDAGPARSVADMMRARGITCKQLPVDAASHAPLVEELRPALMAELGDLRPADGRIPFVSTVTGTVLPGRELTSGYWMRNIRSTVYFAQAIKDVIRRFGANTIFIELGHQPTLQWAIDDIIGSLQAPASSLSSLTADRGDVESFLHSLASAYTLGCDPDWDKLYRNGRYVSLPSYPWARSSFWPAPAAGQGDVPSDGQRSDLLVRRTGVRQQPENAARDDGSAEDEVPSEGLADYLISEICGLLKLDRSEVGLSDSLASIGLDSLRQMQLCTKAQVRLRKRISAGLFLANGTVADAISRWSGLFREAPS
jgi:acyl transferase domain-containing protein/aryl carrier-like protein